MSSVSSLYRRYLLVCNQWTIDSSKSGRDFAVYLRNQIPKLFPDLELSEIKFKDIQKYEKEIESLERLNNNIYYKQNIGFVSSSATGLTANECKQIISTQSLEDLNNLKDSGLLDRIKQTFGTIRFTKSDQ